MSIGARQQAATQVSHEISAGGSAISYRRRAGGKRCQPNAGWDRYQEMMVDMAGAPTFEEEFDRLFGRAFAVARRLTGNVAVAEDLAAEALARTYARWGRVRTMDYREAWVARIATNLAIDAARKKKVDLAAAVEADPSDGTVLRIALVDALARLPRRQREAVALRYLCDLSVDDVAHSLGVSTGTVKTSVHRALEKLRNDLGSDAALIGEEQ
jgi:RNA polymerase sigma-70 factor (sigma-E family)